LDITTNIFTINQRLDIMLSLAKNTKRIASRIEEITPRYYCIAMPISKGIPVILLPGTKFYGRVIVEGLVWQFKSTFIDKKANPVPMWIIEPPQDLKKVQLRSFVRIGAIIPIELKILTDDEEPMVLAATSKDISGGGIQVITKKPLHHYHKIAVTMDIPDQGKIAVSGEVVRVEEQTERGVFWISIKFTEIAEKDRDKIIKYVFKRQLELRQKGL
jgi:c-di-GMP-binding flagellar brake protein YcgR